VEKKLRRAARIASRQGVDIEDLLKKMDPDSLGMIPRADLLTLLMEMGLSLVDAPGVSYSKGMVMVQEGER